MTRKVHCVVDGIDTDGLDFPPWPGAAGKRVLSLFQYRMSNAGGSLPSR